LAVTATFENVSDATVQMLADFEPLPVFFTADLTTLDGTALDVIGMGKADALAGTRTYQRLAPGERLDVRLDLAPWLRGKTPPPPYRLALTYHNAYGQDCFVGTLRSAFVVVPAQATP
jgi:hypothetical protein